MVNLHGLRMYVSSTAADGVVGADTRLEFIQKGPAWPLGTPAAA